MFWRRRPAASLLPDDGRGNAVACPCGHTYRFRHHPRGLIVYSQPPRSQAWTLWRPADPVWPSTITKFRCRCGRHLQPR